MTNRELEQKLKLKREMRIRLSRESFWEFCRTDDPKFYRPRNWHLHLNCEVLQALYERKLTKAKYKELIDEICPAYFESTVDWERLRDEYTDPFTGETAEFVYTKLQQNIPPRFGKSRTLVNFCKWILGKSQENRIITGSYGDDLAMNFSRFTRDGIQEQKTFPSDIVYSDIFPNTKVKQGDSSYQKWSLEGQFFNYKGVGVGGAITGNGCNVSIVDDPVKDADDALNPASLEKTWLWYTGTFMSRQEQGAIEIVNMTRWASKDVCGRIQDSEYADDWLILSMEAMYEIPVYDEDGEQLRDKDDEPLFRKEMLCPQLLDRKRYEVLKATQLEEIFMANYHQHPVDIKGRLYPEFKTYDCLPCDDQGNCLIERMINYTDTADEGKDHLASPCAGVYEGELFITDFIYTKASMEITEPLTARTLIENKITHSKFESNNGGRSFARAVQKILNEEYHNTTISVNWFYQGKNKMARILTNSNYVIQHVYFPVGWEKRWPELKKDLYAFLKEGGSKQVDDGPDAITGLVEMITEGDFAGLIEWMKRQIEKSKEKIDKEGNKKI